jgi:hypothetical protein
MITKTIRTEPSPYEEVMIDSLLESGNGQKELLDGIPAVKRGAQCSPSTAGSAPPGRSRGSA